MKKKTTAKDVLLAKEGAKVKKAPVKRKKKRAPWGSKSRAGQAVQNGVHRVIEVDLEKTYSAPELLEKFKQFLELVS